MFIYSLLVYPRSCSFDFHTKKTTPLFLWEVVLTFKYIFSATSPLLIDYIMPPMSGMPGVFLFSSGLSATTASVVKNIAATDAAF